MSTRRRRHGYRRFRGSVGHVFLSYKAERDVKTIVEVNPRRTTQEGYKCGKEAKKSLAVRTHKGPYYGLEIDRDSNSLFIVLEKRILRSGGQELSEFTPVEIEPIMTEISASSVVKPGSSFL